VASHRLYLLRHAKSSWDEPELADHDRPLAKRGRRAAKLLRDHVSEAGIEPDLVLCSSATRAVETLEGIRRGLGDHARIEIESGLYGAGSETLLRRLQMLTDEIGAVMLIGHNPAIETLAEELAGEGGDGEGGDADAGAQMAAKYPTGGLATLSFDGPWSELDWEEAQLDAFVVPRELG
jgi:phosphohistidine phosphatase